MKSRFVLTVCLCLLSVGDGCHPPLNREALIYSHDNIDVAVEDANPDADGDPVKEPADEPADDPQQEDKDHQDQDKDQPADENKDPDVARTYLRTRDSIIETIKSLADKWNMQEDLKWRPKHKDNRNNDIKRLIDILD